MKPRLNGQFNNKIRKKVNQVNEFFINLNYKVEKINSDKNESNEEK
jgi:hypothetical protein